MAEHEKDEGVGETADAKPFRLLAADERPVITVAQARFLFGKFAPDPALTEDAFLDICCRHLVIPYAQKDGMITLAAVSHSDGLTAIRELPDVLAIADIVIVPKAAMMRYLHKRFGRLLTAQAVDGLYKTKPLFSARTPMPFSTKASAAVLGTCFVGAVFSGANGFFVFWTLVTLYLLATTFLRFILVVSALKSPKEVPALMPGRLPVVTVLIAVYREADSLPALLQALERLRYPKQQLDVKILVEADDLDTRRELKALPVFSWCETIVVPPSIPRTKPKALNYALPFARGEIVGIFDAEDCPEPDQITDAVRTLHNAPAHVICAQARLSHYNPDESALTRCVALEYAMWFDALLLGLSRLGLPVPLGGTSLYIKTRELRALGGWDPDNVTEDADLGLRLARAGYQATVFDSTTYEEATTRVGMWIRQRSRWIKGFMVTWAVHMRHPGRLFAELGVLSALAINVMLLDGFVAFLVQPVFFAMIVAWLLGFSVPVFGGGDSTIVMAVVSVLVSGQVIIIGAALVTAFRRFGVKVALFAPLLSIYWMMGGIAAMLAASQLFGRSRFWDKTPHCVSPIARSRREEAIETLRDSI